MNFVVISKTGKKYSDEELINDLKRVAWEPGRESMKMTEYDERGKYWSNTIAKRFGGWNKALELAGLRVKYHHNTHSREFISDIKRVAEILGKDSISSKEYQKIGKYSKNAIGARFGTWNKALKKAKLTVKFHQKISEEALFENLRQVWLKLGRQPARREMMAPLSKYSERPYISNFGSWQKAVNQFLETVDSEEIRQSHASRTRIRIRRKKKTDNAMSADNVNKSL